MGDLPIKREEAIAYFYYCIVEELLDTPPGRLTEKVKELSNRTFYDTVRRKPVTFSERTLFRMLKKYREKEFNGLVPQPRKDAGTHPTLSKEVLGKILELKAELPTRSAAKIIVMLSLSGKIKEGDVSVRTISRILNQKGYTRESLAKQSRVHIKHECEHINERWQGDIMSAFHLPYGQNGEMRMVYLIGFIDDCSRRDMHMEFYFDSTLPRVEDVLRKAITKFGLPSEIYLDNAKVYISEQFKLICARLGIRLRFCKPYQPAGKGKIEVFWKYVQSSFVTEIKNQKVKSLSELNDLFFAWQKHEYTFRPHSSLEHDGNKISPIKRWELDINAGIRLKYPSPMQLGEAFLHETTRSVNKYGVISFDGNTYEAPAELVLKEITVRYNPFRLDNLQLYYQGKYFSTARVIDLKRERHSEVGNIPETYEYDSEISRLYFKNIRIEYEKYLQDQLNNLQVHQPELKSVPETAVEDSLTKAGPVSFPSSRKHSVSRDEFIALICKTAGIDSPTFSEKGRIYEYWNTFKDFNYEILEDILKKISLKNGDFNRNLFYYLATLQKDYKDQLSKLQEVKRHAR